MSNLPSVRTVHDKLKVSWEKAEKVRRILVDPLVFQPSYNGPYYGLFKSVQRKMDENPGSHSAELQLLAINEVLDLYGVEYIDLAEFERRRHWPDLKQGTGLLAYVNTGQTYDLTLAYDFQKQRFLITSWGDWYERNVIYFGPP